MADMSKRERLRATLAGADVDRPPVAFWRHWPIDDQDAAALARAALDYQRRFDWDFIKITPSHTFCVDDWGAVHSYQGKAIGDRDHRERVVKTPEDWDRLQPLDPERGALGRQLACLRQVLAEREPGTPVIQTIFSPLSIARFLAGDELALVHLRRYPQRCERALAVIAQTTAAFTRAALAAGADGVFLSTTVASWELLSAAEHDRYARPGDLTVLSAAQGGWLNVLHLHGKYPLFAELADYPTQVVNWHDRISGPSLAEAARLYPGALAAGIEQWQVLHKGTPEAVAKQVHDAWSQVGGRRLIVAAGCTYPLTVPEGNLHAARQAVEKLG
ncbi:MAG: uroporphyrinogen decarboxylase family protein [Chloroflexota bacterium]